MSHLRLYGRVGWLILPVVAAGMAHVLILKTRLLARLAVPVDGGFQWNGRPLLGGNKTWRGFLLMTLATGCLASIQARVENKVGNLSPGRVKSRTPLPPWLAGAAMGLAYSLAELPNSFVKRRLGIVPGGLGGRLRIVQYIVDQTDSVFGCVLVARWIHRLRREEVAPAFLLGTVIHIGVDLLTYRIGIKRRKS
jgi:CDP-archaeol synthase